MTNASINGKTTTRTVTDMARGVTRFLRTEGYYPEVCQVDSTCLNKVMVNGEGFSNFYSNSFLGICDHPKLIEAKIKALEDYGTGSGSARLIATPKIHLELEEKIAAFKHREAAIVFSAGQLVNIGVVPALASCPLKHLVEGLGGHDLFGSVTLFIDRFDHSCIFDGAAESVFNFWNYRAKVKTYKHMDMHDLRAQLETDNSEFKVIITDGVFSIHGHIAPLLEIKALANEFNAAIYVDDAHGTGVLGPTGRGTAELLGIDGDIDIPVGTFSKAFGCSGGFVVGDKDFIDYLRVACRTYVFQTAMPPDNAAALIAAIEVSEEESWRREQVLANAAKVRLELERLGFSTMGTKYHIIPAVVGDPNIAETIKHELYGQGVIAGCIKPPVVLTPEESLIRCNIMATHTEEELDRLVTALENSGRRHGIIQ